MVMYALPHKKTHTNWDRWWSFWLCFACQALAIHAEDEVIWFWHRILRNEKDERIRKWGSRKWQRVLGRCWVAGWSWWISVWMIDPGLKLGTYHMRPLPFLVVEPTFEYFGMKEAIVKMIR